MGISSLLTPTDCEGSAKLSRPFKIIPWGEYFYYDETSKTCLRWKVDCYGGKNYASVSIFKGDTAGYFHSNPEKTNFRTCVTLKRTLYQVNRVIWEMFNGPIPEGMVIDHLDGNPWNNKLENLSCKTQAGNTRNRKKNSNNTTGIAGVNLQGEGDKLQYCASFPVVSGGMKRKCFSINKYGLSESLLLAEEYRRMKIEEFNRLNPDESYTDRHGT